MANANDTDDDDRDALFLQWQRLIRRLGHRWYDYCAPLDRATVSPEDVAQEFARAAVARFPRWNPARVSFAGWLVGVARSHATYLRRKALRGMRRRLTLSSTTADGGDWFAAIADPAAPDPAVLVGRLDPVVYTGPDADLPAVLRPRPPVVRGVYRILRDPGRSSEPPTAAAVVAEWRRRASGAASLPVVYRALAELRDLGLASRDGLRSARWRLTTPPASRSA